MDVNKKKKMLSEIIMYNHKVEKVNKESEINKKKAISKLEISVNMIKKDIISMAHSLEGIKEILSSIQNEFKERKMMNKMEVKSYYFKFKEYHKKNIQLLTIFDDLHVNNLDHLIFKFIKIKGKFETLHSVFGFENKEMQLMNNIYTQLEDILNKYKSQIANKLNYSTNNKQNSLDNDTISIYLTMINKQKFISDDIRSIIHKKLLLFQFLLTFLTQSIKRMVPNMNMRTITNNSNILKLLQSSNHIKFNKIKVNNSLLKSTCHLLLIFSNSFFSLLYPSLDTIIFQQSEDCSTVELSSNNSNGRIYHLLKKDYLDYSKELISKSMLTLQSKIRIMKKNEQQMISKKQAETNTINYRQGISQSALFSSFIDHIESKNKQLTKNNSKSHTAKIRNYLIEKHPKKIMSYVEKYQNELVFKERIEKIKATQGRRNKMLINKSRSCILNFKKKQNDHIKDHTQSTYDIDDSYNEHQNDEMNIKRSNILPRMVDINDEKEQTAKIYKRLNDLRNLELRYKDEHWNKEFRDLYLSLQNKYKQLGKNKKRSTNSSFKTFKKDINMFHDNKKMKRNQSFCRIADKTNSNRSNQFPNVSRNKSQRYTEKMQKKQLISLY